MQIERYANGDCSLVKIDCTEGGLTVGELKKLLENVPDNRQVVVNGAYPIIYNTQVPHEDALCFEDEDCVEIEDYISEFDMMDMSQHPNQMTIDFDDLKKCTDCDFNRDCEMDCQNPQGCCKKPPEPELKPSED